MAGYFVFLTLLAILAAASGRRPDESRYEDLHNALRNSPHASFRGHGHGPGRGLLSRRGHGYNMRGHNPRRFDRIDNTADLGHSGLDQIASARASSERRPLSFHHRRMLEKMAGLFRPRGQGHGQGQGRGGQGHHRGYAHGMLGGADRNMRFTPSGRRHHGNNNNNHHGRGGPRGQHHRSGPRRHGGQHRFTHHMPRQSEVQVASLGGNHRFGMGRGERGGERGDRMGPRYTVTR